MIEDKDKRDDQTRQWFAKVGVERLQEDQNPDLIVDRAIDSFLAKGYSFDQIRIILRDIAEKELDI